LIRRGRESKHQLPTLPAVAVALCIVLLLITPHAAIPTLYSPESDAFTPMHDRVSVLRQVSQDTTGVAIPLMEEIFLSSGTLILNLNLKDFESAERDLDEYLARSRQFDNLVIRLDMSQSDLDEWRRLNAQNREDLISLFEDTQRFSDLKRLEIEYRDANDPDMLYSVMYEGEGLRSRIREAVSSYAGRSDEVVAASERYGVETADYIQSVDDARTLSASVEEEQEERSSTIRTAVPPKEGRSITIAIAPEEVRYGDTLTISGRIIGSGSRDVELFLDSGLLWSGAAASDGAYRYQMRIGMIRSGMHTLYATSDGAFSDVLTFRVIRSPTSLTLSSSGGGNVHGVLLSGDTPVSRAPIRILSAGRQVATMTTDAEGRFAGPLRLPPGDHRVIAAFDDVRFPLEPSWSGEVLLHLPPEEERQWFRSSHPQDPAAEGGRIREVILPILIVLVLLALANWGFRNLRRRQTIPDPPAPFMVALPDDIEESHEGAPEPDLPPQPEGVADTVLEAYHAAAGSDYPAALRHLFISLAGAAGLEDPACSTVGDLRKAQSSDPRIHAWLTVYERVLYAGYHPTDEERDRLLAEYRVLREVPP